MTPKDGTARPSFLNALKKRCVYCGLTPMQEMGSWFVFRRGCAPCDFRFEREAGYYTGASWMVLFPAVSVSTLFVCAVTKWQIPSINNMLLCSLASVFALGLGLFLFPYCQALWMYFDHSFHPLHKEDGLEKEWSN